MCTVVVLFRPGHAWPVLFAANRDEMMDRAWRPPARHWPDRPNVVAGVDELAGGTWLGLNDDGVVAGVLNRRHSLGPKSGMRSRGELPLEALDHAEAGVAVAALLHLEPHSYRPFNMVIADARAAFWLRAAGGGEDGSAGPAIEAFPLPPGLSMITAYDRDDMASPRIRFHRERFESAPAPDPDKGDWSAWQGLLGSREREAGQGPGAAMTIATESGFGTVCSSLIALSARPRLEVKPIWLFAAGPPDRAPFEPISL